MVARESRGLPFSTLILNDILSPFLSFTKSTHTCVCPSSYFILALMAPFSLMLILLPHPPCHTGPRPPRYFHGQSSLPDNRHLVHLLCLRPSCYPDAKLLPHHAGRTDVQLHQPWVVHEGRQLYNGSAGLRWQSLHLLSPDLSWQLTV